MPTQSVSNVGNFLCMEEPRSAPRTSSIEANVHLIITRVFREGRGRSAIAAKRAREVGNSSQISISGPHRMEIVVYKS